MSPIKIYLCAYAEESAGQLAELERFAVQFDLRLYRAEELKDIEFGTVVADEKRAEITANNVYIDKRNNPDIIRAVRAAILLEAEGILIKFGNNPTRDYIKNNLCFSANEVKKALFEVRRLAPLFGRGQPE